MGHDGSIKNFECGSQTYVSLNTVADYGDCHPSRNYIHQTFLNNISWIAVDIMLKIQCSSPRQMISNTEAAVTGKSLKDFTATKFTLLISCAGLVALSGVNMGLPQRQLKGITRQALNGSMPEVLSPGPGEFDLYQGRGRCSRVFCPSIIKGEEMCNGRHD